MLTYEECYLLKHCEKGGNVGNQHFLLSTLLSFSPILWKSNLILWVIWDFLFENVSYLNTVKMFCMVNPFPNKPWFWLVCSISLLKGRAIFPFPTVFSTDLENFLQFSSKLKLSSENSFSLKQSKICRWERIKSSEITLRPSGSFYPLLHNPDF